MTQKITVMDPRGYPPKVEGKRLAARPESLDGKVLYLIDCLFDNSDAFLEQVRLWFAQHMPSVQVRWEKPKESWVDDPDMRRRVAEGADAAIIAVGL